MTPTDRPQKPRECEHCSQWSEQGYWYVSGALKPYGRCERLFAIYKKKPCGQDIDRLARTAHFHTCPDFTPKTKKK